MRNWNRHYVPGRVRDGVLEKRVGILNKLRRWDNAYAMSIAQLDESESLGAREVLLIERETGRRLRAPIHLIREKGTRLHFPDYEEQIGLPERFWSIES